MSGAHDTPIGTPVVLAPGKVVLVGEYAALADGNTVEAAFGCYARAQFIPQMDSVMTLVSEIIERIKVEVTEVAPALPPGAVLLTNEDFRAVGTAAAGLGSSAAMAVAAVGAVLESLGLALESQKPLVFRIADAARRKTQGYLGSGSDAAASTYGGLIRTGRAQDGQRLVLPLAPPAGLHLVVFSAGPSLPPAKVAQALERHAREDAISFLEAVAKLRDAAQRFLDEASSGQATAAIAAAGTYGEILQGLCAAAQAPIMNPAFTRAAELAREFGGMAKPTGVGEGEIGVALFATPEAAGWFRKACTDPLVALEGDLDVDGVRCEFPDNVVGADLDERNSAEILDPDPEEFPMPTVRSTPTVQASVHEAPTVRNPVEEESTLADSAPGGKPTRQRRGLVLGLVAVALALAGIVGLLRARPAPAPIESASERESIQPPPAVAVTPPPVVEAAPPEPPVAVKARKQETIQPTPVPAMDHAPAAKGKRPKRAMQDRPTRPRAGNLRVDDF
jgi:mevalonate kinase